MQCNSLWWFYSSAMSCVYTLNIYTTTPFEKFNLSTKPTSLLSLLGGHVSTLLRNRREGLSRPNNNRNPGDDGMAKQEEVGGVEKRWGSNICIRHGVAKAAMMGSCDDGHPVSLIRDTNGSASYPSDSRPTVHKGGFQTEREAHLHSCLFRLSPGERKIGTGVGLEHGSASPRDTPSQSEPQVFTSLSLHVSPEKRETPHPASSSLLIWTPLSQLSPLFTAGCTIFKSLSSSECVSALTIKK